MTAPSERRNRESTRAKPSRCRSAGAVAILLAVLAPLAGCGSSLPDTVPVRGRVTWQGQPIEQGTVAFMPQETAKGLPRRAATGRIQSDGTYRMSTFGDNDGVIPGEYAVAISDVGEFPVEAIPSEEPPAPTGVLPASYATAHASGLTVTVPTGSAPLEIDFDLPRADGGGR